jgi:peptidoglycan/xylan/chitin deacetylase (PgdA/CDA1 family)
LVARLPGRGKRAVRRLAGRLAPSLWRLRHGNSLLILTYHRVLPPAHADREVEQPGMYVAPETLAMNLEVIKRHFDLMHLSEWLGRRASGQALPRRACCITFDDGWRDNYQHAFPVLRAARAPATIFLVAGFIGTRYEFWPNRLARLLQSAGTSAAGAGSTRLAQLLSGISAKPGEPDGALIDRAIQHCKSVPDSTMIELLDEAEGHRPDSAPVTGRSLLDADEIRAMRDSGCIDFGSHSVRHTRLVEGLDAQSLNHEVVESRSMLEKLLARPVELFCYPNGDVSATALRAVRDTYRAAVTTQRGWNTPSADPYLLRRMTIHEGVAADPRSFLARVSGLL